MKGNSLLAGCFFFAPARRSVIAHKRVLGVFCTKTLFQDKNALVNVNYLSLFVNNNSPLPKAGRSGSVLKSAAGRQQLAVS